MAPIIETVPDVAFDMRFFRFGRKGAPPVVILPGVSVRSVMLSAEFVRKAYAPLAEKHEVYVMEPRLNPPDNYPLEEMAMDTARALDALSIRGACLLGVSMGGMASQVIALKRPELVRCLVLESTACRVTETIREGLCRWLRLAEEGRGVDLMLEFSKMIYTADFAATYRDAFKMLGRETKPEELSRFAISLRGMLDFDVSSSVGGITCPVFVIGGAQDQLIDQKGPDALPGRIACQSYIYPDYGHAVYDEAPDVVGRIRAYLELQNY